MVRVRRIAAWFGSSTLLAAIFVTFVQAQPKPDRLKEVLQQMDAASLKFQSGEADFEWDVYERVVADTAVQQGTIYFKKEGTSTVMGIRVLSPAIKIIEFRKGILRLFNPGTDHLTRIDGTKNSAQFEAFLTVFGGSGKDLAKAWVIADLGNETINSVQTAKLDLVPKDAAVRKNCTHMTIWVDPVRGMELKQILYMPSEDRRTSVYTNVKYNQNVDEEPYQIKTDSKTTVDHY